MHHLKKWFGIKDWQGPDPKPDIQSDTSQNDVKKLEGPETLKAVNKEEIVKTKSIITTENIDIDILRSLPENESVFLRYNNKFEKWLRQYIPVEKDECAQCRLVTTAAVGAGYSCFMVYMNRIERGAALSSKGHKCFRVFQVCFTTYVAINLYFYLFKTGLFQKRLEGETNQEFQKRLYIEDMEWYRQQFKRIHNWTNKTDSEDSKS